MYSRFVFRSIQNASPSLIFNRFVSVTQVHCAAATKLKEKPSTSATPAEKPAATKTEKLATPLPAANVTNAPVEDKTPIPPPTTGATDPNKTYSDKIRRLVDEISKLSLVDVMDLNELLKVKISRIFYQHA